MSPRSSWCRPNRRLCIVPSSVFHPGPPGPQRTRRQKEPQRQEEPPVAGQRPEEQQEEHGRDGADPGGGGADGPQHQDPGEGSS